MKLQLTEIKKTADKVFSLACSKTTNQSRGAAVAALFAACDELGLVGADKRFAAEYGLACFGYGGGL